MTDPIPTEAVEAVETVLTDAGVDLYDNVHDLARLALTAAAPFIAAQATADLRAGIEALRDEWHKEHLTYAASANMRERLDFYGQSVAYRTCADALDALLRERAR